MKFLGIMPRKMLVDAARYGSFSGKDDFDLKFYYATSFGKGYEEDVYKALQLATQNGNLQLVTWLLEKIEPLISKSDQQLVNFFSGGDGPMVSSPVFVAVEAGHLDVVRKLINHDAVLRIDPPTWFEELVQWAARWGHASIVNFLIRESRFLNLADISCMAHTLNVAAFYHGHSDVLKVILECSLSRFPLQQGAYYGIYSMDGLTSLHLAARSGFLGAVELLVGIAGMGAAMKSDEEKFTPLHLAANFGHVEVVNCLLSPVCEIMARDFLGRTALHYAAREGHVQVVQALVQAQEDIALVHDADGLLALHMAARAGHVEVIKALNPFGGIMLQSKHSLEVKSWIEREYNTREEFDSWDKCSLFYIPGKKWRIPRMKLFDSLFWKTEGFTPLHFAARYGYGAAVKELLKNRDAAGSSALFVQDSGGFLAYDWMKVQKQGKAFVASCSTAVGEMSDSQRRAWLISGGLDVNLCNMELELELELEKRSSGLSACEISAGVIAGHIREEKEAVEELKRAIRHGGVGNIEKIINRVPVVVQWLLEDVREPIWLSYSSTVNPYGFHALNQALQKENFVAAKHILLHYPRVDLSLDGAHVIGRVKELLSKHDYEKEEKEYYRNSHLENFLIVLVTREELALGAGALRLLARWAKDHDLTSLLGVIMNRSELKRGLYEDRQLYVDCANAMLVGAALIAGVAFQGWLQPPLGYSYEYQGSEYADVHEKAVRAFRWSNNGAFFLAVASLIAGAKGAVPVRHEIDVMRSLEKVRRAVGVASSFLGMALVCVVGAYSAAGFAVLPPLSSDLQIMRICVGCGSSLCAVVLLWFGLGVWPLVTETIRYLAPRIKEFLVFCVFCNLLPLLYGVSNLLPSRFGYALGKWVGEKDKNPLMKRVWTRILGVITNTHSTI